MIVLPGTSLPTLSNPGTAKDLRYGRQLIDGNGNAITGTMPIAAGTTIYPGTSNKTAISTGYYAAGDIIVAGDADLKPENIVSGKNIFGVNGTYGSKLTVHYYGSYQYPAETTILRYGMASSGYILRIESPAGMTGFQNDIKAVFAEISTGNYSDHPTTVLINCWNGSSSNSAEAWFSCSGNSYQSGYTYNNNGYLSAEIPQGIIDYMQLAGNWNGGISNHAAMALWLVTI